MIKKVFLLLCAFIFITGCSNYIELNNIGIVNMIGITKNKGDYIVSINMIIPLEEGKNKIKSYSSKDSNLSKAINKLYEKSLRKIYLSHVDLLLLSDNLVKEDYLNIINLFLNRNDSRNTFSTVVVKNYNINSISKVEPDDINSLLEVVSKDSGTVRVKQFDEVVQDVLEYNLSYIPYLDINKEDMILGYKQVYSSFKSISKENSIAYNFITNNIDSTNLVSKDKINFHINKNNTTLMVDKNNITININSNIDIESYNNKLKVEDCKKIYNNLITSYLDDFIKNNDLDFFYNLIKKYDYDYYIRNKNIKINFKYKVISSINNNSSSIGGYNNEEK